MAFFSKLKERLFKSSSKLEEGLEAIVAEGKADMVALARAVMDDPRWVWHAAQKLGVEVPYPVSYARAAPGLWPGASTMRLP